MSDSMRNEFEAWHRSVVEGEPPHEKYNSGDYRNQHVQRYWLSWKASRESLVMPHFRGYSFEGYQYYDADTVDDALSDLGLKEKP